MKVRVSGTFEECERIADVLEQSMDMEVLSCSQWYSWTRHDPKSRIGAMYLEVRRCARTPATTCSTGGTRPGTLSCRTGSPCSGRAWKDSRTPCTA